MNQNRQILTLSLLIILFTIFGCAATSPENNTTADIGSHFYFVQMTDTHFGDANHYDRTKKIVSAINDLPMKLKCVVHTGDVTSDNILQDSIAIKGTEILGGLQVPIHFVPGNHDIDEKNLELTRRKFEQYFGPLLTVQEYEGVQFVTVFTEPIAQGYQLEGYNPLEELEAVLSNGKPTLVFHHSPSPDDFYRNKMHDSWEESGRLKWEALLNKYNVKAVMAGHYHRDEHHWLGEVPLYVSGPVGSWYGRQPTYRIYEYKDGKLGYRTQYILMDRWKNGQIPTLVWD